MFKKWTQYLIEAGIFNVGLSQMTEVFSSSLSEFLVCHSAASACYRSCTGLGVRTKLLGEISQQKNLKPSLIKRILVLYSLKYLEREPFQFRSEQPFFMEPVT
ncbi:MAG: hypothetical protein ACJ705_04005 [Nitrososphaeraceae archaeon]